MLQRPYWNKNTTYYKEQLLELCPACKTTAVPPTPHKGTLNRYFCGVIHADHFFLAEKRIIHFMDFKTLFSVVGVVSDLSAVSVWRAFEALVKPIPDTTACTSQSNIP